MKRREFLEPAALRAAGLTSLGGPVPLTTLSGLLAVLAFPRFDLAGLAWVSLAPLLFALRRTSSPRAAGLGLLFGCVFGGGTLYWWFGRLGGTPAASILLAYLGFAAYYLLFGLLYNLVSRRAGGWLVLAAPALWVALEYARANLGFLAFPWDLLGDSQYRALPVIQVADLTGVYGISFLLVLVNQALSQLPELLTRRRVAAASAAGPRAPAYWATQLGLPALALLLALGYGWYRLGGPESGDRLRVAVVQANLVPRNGMPGREQLNHLQEYGRLTQEAARRQPDLIVWHVEVLDWDGDGKNEILHTNAAGQLRIRNADGEIVREFPRNNPISLFNLCRWPGADGGWFILSNNTRTGIQLIDFKDSVVADIPTTAKGYEAIGTPVRLEAEGRSYFAMLVCNCTPRHDSRLYLYDPDGDIIYEEKLLSSQAALLAVPDETAPGLESLLVGEGEGRVWQYRLAPTTPRN